MHHATASSVGVYFADVVAPRGAANNLPVGKWRWRGQLLRSSERAGAERPKGTLFGCNTTGGAVLLVPRRPTDKLEGYVEGSYGNYDMRRGQAVLNVPPGDTARFRIGVDRMRRDGYVRNTGPVGPDACGNVDYAAVRARAFFDWPIRM